MNNSSKEQDASNQGGDANESLSPVTEPGLHSSRPVDEIVYNSDSELRSPVQLVRNIVADCYAGRELAWRLFQRNLKGMYRQTFFGFFWAFLPPIANTAMWIFLKNQNVFKMEGTGVDSTVYILTGMILWQGFVEAFNMPIQVLQKNSNMVRKLNFPRESLLMVGFAEVLFNLAVRMVLLLPAFLWFGVPFQWSMLLAFPAIVGMVLLGAAMGMFLMPLDSLFKDIGKFITMWLPFWMILTPIIYVPRTEGVGALLNWINPAAPLLILARDFLLVGADSPHLLAGLIFGLVAVPLFLVGMIYYRIALPVIIERMAA